MLRYQNIKSETVWSLLLGPLGPVLLVLAAPALLRVVERALVDGHRVVVHRGVPGDSVGVRRRGRT